ncbi:MAG: serine hydroxymethyltransferase, partial [Mesorhizobium sp.]
AITMLDWKAHGRAYAAVMAGTAKALASALAERGLPVFSTAKGHTASHQFAIEAAEFGGGQAAAKRLRRANILTCGIGLPVTAVDGDMNGLRFGTPEIVRWGMTEKDMPELAALIARGLRGNDAVEDVAADVSAFRRRFTKLHFVS